MNTRYSLLCTFAILLLAIPSAYNQTPASSGVCYATSGNADGGRFFTLDPTTGAATLVGDITGANAVSGIAIDKDGNIYASDVTNAFGGSVLIRIDAATGAPTPIGNTGIIGLDAIAFGPDGTLYGAETGGADAFYSIDPNTGAATYIGQMGIPNQVVGMAFDPTTGILYASTGDIPPSDGIFTIDPSTGAGTFIGNTGLGKSTPDIFFDLDGNLYGTKGGGQSGNSSIISIDKNTGLGTVIGFTGFRAISGIDCYLAPPIPTLGEWSLIILGLSFMIIGVIAVKQRVVTSTVIA